MEYRAGMAFDPQSVAALVASIAQQTDDLEYHQEIAPTDLRAVNLERYPAASTLLPAAGDTPLLVRYWVVYRRVRFCGELVVGLANVATAIGILAEDSLFQIQSYDLRFPVTPYTPGGRGVVSGP